MWRVVTKLPLKRNPGTVKVVVKARRAGVFRLAAGMKTSPPTEDALNRRSVVMPFPEFPVSPN